MNRITLSGIAESAPLVNRGLATFNLRTAQGWAITVNCGPKHLAEAKNHVTKGTRLTVEGELVKKEAFEINVTEMLCSCLEEIPVFRGTKNQLDGL